MTCVYIIYIYNFY